MTDGRTVAYVSDGFHRRIQRRINGTLVQQLVYLDQLEPHAELDGAGNVVATFVYTDRSHVPTLMRKNGRWYRIVSDPLGSVRLVVDLSDGLVAQRLDYDEFGRVLLDSSPGFQPFGFAGGLYDRDTGLVRFGARDYDPATGRWTAKDPARFGGGQNFYLYGWGDPVNTLDVNGEVPVVLIAGAMSYARCVATRTALEGLLTALSGECDLDLPDLTGDCALDCLNPLNWAGIGKAGDLLKMADRSRRKPGNLGKFKGADALGRENRMARDAAAEGGLRPNTDAYRNYHDELSRSGISDYQTFVQIARSYARGP